MNKKQGKKEKTEIRKFLFFIKKFCFSYFRILIQIKLNKFDPSWGSRRFQRDHQINSKPSLFNIKNGRL